MSIASKGELNADNEPKSPRKTIYEIVPATEEHVRDLAPRLRLTDSLIAMGLDPSLALAKYVGGALESMAGLANGRVVLIFGAYKLSLLDEGIYVWMFGDHEIPRHSAKIAREGKKWIIQFRERYAHVFTHVDVTHAKALRWVDYLGFRTVGEVFAGGRKFMKMELV